MGWRGDGVEGRWEDYPCSSLTYVIITAAGSWSPVTVTPNRSNLREGRFIWTRGLSVYTVHGGGEGVVLWKLETGLLVSQLTRIQGEFGLKIGI